MYSGWKPEEEGVEDEVELIRESGGVKEAIKDSIQMEEAAYVVDSEHWEGGQMTVSDRGEFAPPEEEEEKYRCLALEDWDEKAALKF